MTDKTNRLAQGQQETGGACLDGALEARKAQRQDREQHQAARVKALQALLEHLPFSDEGRRRLCDDLGTVNALMTEVAEELAADVGPDADTIGHFVGLKNAGWPPPFALMCALALRPMATARSGRSLVRLSAFRSSELSKQLLSVFASCAASVFWRHIGHGIRQERQERLDGHGVPGAQ